MPVNQCFVAERVHQHKIESLIHQQERERVLLEEKHTMEWHELYKDQEAQVNARLQEQQHGKPSPVVLPIVDLTGDSQNTTYSVKQASSPLHLSLKSPSSLIPNIPESQTWGLPEDINFALDHSNSSSRSIGGGDGEPYQKKPREL